MRRVEGHTAGGRPEPRSRNMDEHRTAAVCNPRAGIVVKLDDQVVEVIIAPQPVAGRVLAQSKRPVVASVGRVFAPRVGPSDAADRQSGARPRTAVRPPPHL